MSSYIRLTKNPDTEYFEQAEWLDDYFGSHEYGVRFPSTGIVYKASDYEWKDDPVLMAMVPIGYVRKTITKDKTIAGKRIETTQHTDGRKDVKIEVNSLDVDLNDPSNAEAKKVIEEDVLPAIANKQITVTVIHKPTNESASFVCARKNVRDYAERVVTARGGDTSEFCLVEHDGEDVKVTTL